MDAPKVVLGLIMAVLLIIEVIIEARLKEVVHLHRVATLVEEEVITDRDIIILSQAVSVMGILITVRREMVVV